MSVVGVGLDIIDIDRFRASLDDALARELFLPGEIEYCEGRARPWESYAARFAAKEAAFKALGRGLAQGMTWHSVEVVREESGAVSLLLRGPALARAGELGVTRMHVTLSHDATGAVAAVIMESTGGGPS